MKTASGIEFIPARVPKSHSDESFVRTSDAEHKPRDRCSVKERQLQIGNEVCRLVSNKERVRHHRDDAFEFSKFFDAFKASADWCALEDWLTPKTL
jgi:hypothetical protein